MYKRIRYIKGRRKIFVMAVGDPGYENRYGQFIATARRENVYKTYR